MTETADNAPAARRGPLAGVNIVEFGGIGPGPFCAMLLQQMGADVVRIERPGAAPSLSDGLARTRLRIALDLKSDAGRTAALRLIAGADAAIEGNRPGVMERLGLGPADCLAVRPALVYGRMTGWGQAGPLAGAAGHDINYIALTGALHAMGPAHGGPAIPLNLVGDFGGGALYLALGIVAAVLEARSTGQGQVVDAAILDGTASLMGLFYGMVAQGQWHDRREANRLDGGAPYYRCYATADGKHVAVGALEPQFYRDLVQRLGMESLPDRDDPRSWPELHRRFEAVFATKTRDEWAALLEGTDACCSPVLSIAEAPRHAHNVARGVFVCATPGGVGVQAAPRFSAHADAGPPPPLEAAEVLGRFGLSPADGRALFAAGATAQEVPA